MPLSNWLPQPPWKGPPIPKIWSKGRHKSRPLALFPRDMKRKAEETLKAPYCWLEQGGLILLDSIVRGIPVSLAPIEQDILLELMRVGGYSTYDHLIYVACPWLSIEDASREIPYYISKLTKEGIIDSMG